MIKCKKCGNPNITFAPVCYHCASEFELTAFESKALLAEAADYMKKRKYQEAVDLYKFLGGVGVTEGERVFAFILERGVLVPRDLDMAMKYYFSAAKKGDSHSAYRYAKLISRANSETSDFWLSLAALLGEKAAYADAVALYDKLGDDIPTEYGREDGYIGSYTETKKIENPSSKNYSHEDGIDSWAEIYNVAGATD